MTLICCFFSLIFIRNYDNLSRNAYYYYKVFLSGSEGGGGGRDRWATLMCDLRLLIRFYCATSYLNLVGKVIFSFFLFCNYTLFRAANLCPCISQYYTKKGVPRTRRDIHYVISHYIKLITCQTHFTNWT